MITVDQERLCCTQKAEAVESDAPAIGERWLALPWDTQKSVFEVAVVDLHDGQFLCRLTSSTYLIPRERMLRRTAKAFSLKEQPKVGDIWYVERGYNVVRMKLIAVGGNEEIPYLFRELGSYPSECLASPRQLFARHDSPVVEDRHTGIAVLGYAVIAVLLVAIVALAIGARP